MNEASTQYDPGPRTSVIARGASPKVPVGARLNAAGLSQVADGWSAEASRSAKLPAVASSAPVKLGRLAFAPPSRESAGCCTLIGNPLCSVIAAAMVQPADQQIRGVGLFAQRLPAPKGNSTIGARSTRCGTSSMLTPYSANGSSRWS